MEAIHPRLQTIPCQATPDLPGNWAVGPDDHVAVPKEAGLGSVEIR